MKKIRTIATESHEDVFDHPTVVGLDASELWIDEHARHRLLDACGQVMLEGLLDITAASSRLW